MNILKSLRNAYSSFAALSGIKTAFGTDKLDDGRSIEYIGDVIEAGTAVNVLDENNNPSVLPDGDYKTESGLEFKVTDGLVSEVNDPNVQPAEAAEDSSIEETVDSVTEDVSETIKDLIHDSIEEAVSKVSENLSKQNSQIAQLAAIVEKIAERAGGEPVGEAVGFSKKQKEKSQHQENRTALSVFAEEARKK